jgi:hypothetical protein
MRRSDGRQTVVPYHAARDLKREVLRAIIRQAGLTPDEFAGSDVEVGSRQFPLCRKLVRFAGTCSL